MHSIVVHAAHSFHKRLSEQRKEFPRGCLSVSKHTLQSDRDPGDQILLISLWRYIFVTRWRKRCHRSHHCRPESTPVSFPVKKEHSRISIWGIRTLRNIDLKRNLSSNTPPPTTTTTTTTTPTQPVLCSLKDGLSCPVCHPTADVSSAVYIRATGRLPDAEALWVYQHVRVFNTDTTSALTSTRHPGSRAGARLKGESRIRAFNLGWTSGF